jgi:DEAD/DEAH box helicase domain-containing protein
MNKIFLDLETQLGKDDVGGWYPQRMKLAVAGTYDQLNGGRIWYESDVNTLVGELLNFDKIIGFNVINFDYQVLLPYDDRVNALNAKTIDMLSDIHSILGFRLKLDDIAASTIGRRKSGDGLQSLKWWKEDRKEKVVEYCLEDVLITRDVYEYGRQHKSILYPSFGREKSLSVFWI